MPKLHTYKAYLGLDPGKNGGIAAICDDRLLFAYQIPFSESDLWRMVYNIPRKCVTPSALIEKVHSMPKQGVTSAFTFGVGYGALTMSLIAASIPFETVTPQVWQKGLKIPPRKKDEAKTDFKNRLLSITQKMYPAFSLWAEPKAKGRQLAVADAILIATYLYRKSEGKL